MSYNKGDRVLIAKDATNLYYDDAKGKSGIITEDEKSLAPMVELDDGSRKFYVNGCNLSLERKGVSVGDVYRKLKSPDKRLRVVESIDYNNCIVYFTNGRFKEFDLLKTEYEPVELSEGVKVITNDAGEIIEKGSLVNSENKTDKKEVVMETTKTINNNIQELFPKTVDAVLVQEELGTDPIFKSELAAVLLAGKSKDILAAAQDKKEKREEAESKEK